MSKLCINCCRLSLQPYFYLLYMHSSSYQTQEAASFASMKRDACLDLTKLSLQGKWMMASQSRTCRGNFTFWLSLVFVDSC